MQILNGRSVTAVVVLFTAAAVAMLWGLTARWQSELREHVSARAEQRSLQLADAMAGKVAADFRLLDHLLLDMRDQVVTDPAGLRDVALRAVGRLPAGSAQYLSQLDASGRLIFNLDGRGLGLDLSDRPYFLDVKTGEDRFVIGAPFQSRVNGAWLIPVGRAVYRDGHFDGALFLLLSPDYLSQRLAQLVLGEGDIVAMVNSEGQFLARSRQNLAAMGKAVPSERPFLVDRSSVSGTFRRNGEVDKVSRLYGWKRVPDSGVVVAVGLAESSAMAPLAPSMARSNFVTGLLSMVLALGGVTVAWLLWRAERTGRDMQESARLLEEAQRMAKVGHWSFDHRTRELTWSDEMYRIYGKRRAIDRPTYENFLESVHPADRSEMAMKLRQLVKGGGTLENRFRVVMPDGSEKSLYSLSDVDQEDGRTVRTHGTVQDITEVRNAHLALERMNNELEARVATRTHELALLNNELEAFTYSVSHDLRTPLRSIHGFASLLEEEGENLSPEGRTHLRRIQDGARRMGLLITDLLTMAQHSRAMVNLQRLNLSELAQAVVQDIEREDPQRKVVWQIEPAMWGMADPVLMRVVLQNLLGNAWKYTGQTPRAEISFRAVERVGGRVTFCVSDNGAGFDMSYVDQLFQPFKRLHAHHEFEGTGVGLASVQRLIQRHGGTVRAEGAVGLGAAFYFTLPNQVPSPRMSAI